MKTVIIALFLFVLTVSCVSVGRKIEPAKVEKIKQGESTKQDVLTLMGSPDQMTSVSTGDTMFHYFYVRATPKPASFIPLVGPLVGGANTQNQAVMITFGPDGVVKSITSSHGSTQSDTGVTTGPKPKVDDVEMDKRE